MQSVEVKVPDIGEFTDVDVIELLVKPGDTVGVDDPLIAIESEKATMEVPAPQAGVVKELKVKLGDKVSEGSIILVLEAETASSAPDAKVPATPEAKAPAPGPALRLVTSADATSPSIDAAPSPSSRTIPATSVTSAPAMPEDHAAESSVKPHASPSVRKMARELGVNLNLVKGSGRNGRIFRVDIQKFVSAELSKPKGSGVGLDLIPWPKLDFTKFGETETRPLSRIRKHAKANLARNWVMIPHVTQFDEADVTELEAFRAQINLAKSNAI